MLNIFNYTDFRKYLGDYYKERKKENSSFSYQYIANKAGFRNKGFVYNIINGNKILSKSNIFKISQALNFNVYEAEYFENLVSFNQADNLKERNYFYERLSKIKNRGRGNHVTKAQLVREDQYEFYSYWYYGAIRSLIDMYEFKDDYKWLTRIIHPSITIKQAKNAVTTLEKLGLIEKQKNGVYKVKNKTLTTGKEVSSLAVSNLYFETMKLAAKALRELPKHKRNITGLLLGISQKTYRNICEEIQKFQTKILQIAEKDEKADTVYQFNFHLFPMSHTEKKAGKK
jgi:uncharacterized protein (TIGR02147 family)